MRRLTQKQVAKRLRDHITALGWSQEDYARSTDTSLVYINKVIGERAMPGPKILKRMGLRKVRVTYYEEV